ncbi:MAG TPA: hypothetical protein VFR86_28560 [Burkholderiaceae bacterium]|nr:hypothetical protein [Burkholderiaceae bacterium]
MSARRSRATDCVTTRSRAVAARDSLRGRRVKQARKGRYGLIAK